MEGRLKLEVERLKQKMQGRQRDVLAKDKRDLFSPVLGAQVMDRRKVRLK